MEEDISEQEKEALNLMLENDIKIVAKLEDFFCTSRELSNLIQTVFNQNNYQFKESVDGEHSIENYTLYKNYCSQLVGCLEDFFKKEGLKEEIVISSCSRVKDLDDHCMTCIDYLIAASDYQEFYGLMMEFRDMTDFEGEDKNNDIDYHMDESSQNARVNIVDNSGSKILKDKHIDDEIEEEIIIETENKLKFVKK